MHAHATLGPTNRRLKIELSNVPRMGGLVGPVESIGDLGCTFSTPTLSPEFSSSRTSGLPHGGDSPNGASTVPTVREFRRLLSG